MTRRQRRLQEKRRRHGRQLAVGAGATVGATLLMGGVANAANVTVDSLADAPDPGHTTLRDALHVVNTTGDPASNITFASGLSGTINLNNELQVNYPVSIQGPGAGQLTISGQDNVRIFYLEGAANGFDVSISGLTLAHGHAEGYESDRLGGAVFSYNADLTVSSSVLTQNSANSVLPDESAFGGAICSCVTHAGSLTVLNSTLSGNSSSFGGGAIYDFFAPMTIRNTAIIGNSARVSGGGVAAYHPDGAVSIEDTTITGNSAPSQYGGGGGLYSYARSNAFTVSGSTIVGNSAGRGGGVSEGGGGGLPFVLQNSIVANNTAADGPDLRGPFNAAFSLIRSTAGAAVTDTVPGSDIVGANPQLNGLAPNGGPTQTMKPALTSPVVDKGAAFGLGSDQRGATRPVEIPTIPNSTAPGADGSDIGAVELQSSDFTTPKKKCKKKRHKKHKRFADSAKKKHKKAQCKKKHKKKKR